MGCKLLRGPSALQRIDHLYIGGFVARYTGPKNKLSRREGVDLFGTGSKSLQKRLNIPPGGMPRRRRKTSDYGLQLREKQKVKRMYGLLERQFRKYFRKSVREKGNTGEALLT